jgi:peptidase E
MVSEVLRGQQQQPLQQTVDQTSARSFLLNQLLEQPMYENHDHQKATNYEEQLVLPLRLLYIPTAMYALRKDSLNTPGKQRQRARADAKSRRDTIVQYLQNLFVHDPHNATTNSPPITIDVSALTLDLEDGSLKHPFGSTTFSSNKVNNKAITISKSNVNINITSFLYTYSPHIIYVDGGNTFWLHHCLSRNNNYYWDALVQFCSNAQHDYERNSTNSSPSSSLVLYCGQSAGAIVAGSYVETATWKGWDDPSIVPGMEDPQSWKGVPGMDLFCNNISIFPHYAEEWKDLVQSKNQTDFTTNNGTALKTRLVCLSNSEVLAITGGRYTNGSCQQSMQFFSTANVSYPIVSFAAQ